MKRLTLTIAALACWAGALGAMHRWEAAKGPTEYMSLPPLAATRVLGAGFDNMVADGLYLQFVHYFGKHLRRDKAYHNMAQVLDAITELDPRFESAYVLGGMALGDAGEREAVRRLWAKGARYNPDNWQLLYQGGMGLFLLAETDEEYALAATYFQRAAALPGAPPEASYMEARCHDVTNRQDLALHVWRKLYATGASAEERGVAKRALERLGVRPGTESSSGRNVSAMTPQR